MRAGIPARTARSNGRRSRESSVFRLLRTTGSSSWESVSVAPCPGKCFPTGITPRERVARKQAVPRRAACSGSAESARSPITGLSGLLSTSSTGAKLMSTPTARSSDAIAPAAASAARPAWQQRVE
ncbi:MAG: hypothetical protein A2X88_02255 [Deltaproteobacteria bacterium GWC2_65_14]|nr:MAG: hypothetical protein A2X88_02255 [Deltaproteobacteria bacterium GWC2_65_14]